MQILVPKAKEEQARWRQTLAEYEQHLSFTDPWQIDVLPETAEARSVWLNLDRFSCAFCVSPTAAKVLAEALDTYWPMPPVQVHWLCNGPRTAAVLDAADLSPVFPDSGHTSEDVLALPQARLKPDDHCLIIKGEGGRSWMAEQLQGRGVKVQSLDVYRRSLNSGVLADIQARASRLDAIWITSQFLAEQLIKIKPEFWRNWTGQYWVSSQRLSDWAQKQGISNIRVATGATPAAMNELLTSELQKI